jgi:DNA-binding CsgD family transcriptional regulator
LGSNTVRYGTVTTPADAAAALLVVIGGAGIVVDAQADAVVIDRLLEDLRHLGPVEHRRAVRPVPHVTHEGQQILRLLAAGMTLGAAASELGIARRTADRRLAEARRILGVERTAEAVARARRLGWIG